MTTPLGKNLRRLRKAAGMTQQELAVAAGLNASIVAQIEQGRNTDPRASTLLALARALSTTVDELFREPARPPGGDDDTPPEAPKRRKK
jgi:transcriptional regulator with XRE-family HTH domain